MSKVKREWLRKAIHLGGLWIPIGYGFVDRRTAILVLCTLTLACFLTEYLRLTFQRVNRLFVQIVDSMLRPDEHRHLTGLSYYLTGALLSVLFFSKVIAILSVCFLVVGDFFAGLVGTYWGRTRIFHKSLEGSFACFAICALMGWTLLASQFEFSLKVALTLIGALTATVAELLSTGINDNITVPLISGLAMTTVVELQR